MLWVLDKEPKMAWPMGMEMNRSWVMKTAK